MSDGRSGYATPPVKNGAKKRGYALALRDRVRCHKRESAPAEVPEIVTRLFKPTRDVVEGSIVKVSPHMFEIVTFVNRF